MGTALSVAMSLVAAPASSAATPAWMMTAGNVQSLSQQDPATTAHFFNTPAAYGAGASLVQSPVQHGYATTPVLAYTSYAQFEANIDKGNISYPYKWVMYDPENWSQTPRSERLDPIKYMRLFGQLAHANGLKVIQVPARDLGTVAGSVIPRQPRESVDQWYINTDLAGTAAMYGDAYVIQDEYNETNLTEYDWLYSNAASQAQAANPGIQVLAEVSTATGTPAQMATAAQSVSASGYYVAAPGAIPQADRFFQTMQSAGY